MQNTDLHMYHDFESVCDVTDNHADHLQAHQAASICAPPSSLKAKYTCTHVCKMDIGVMSHNFESETMWLGRRVVASLSAGQ